MKKKQLLPNRLYILHTTWKDIISNEIKENRFDTFNNNLYDSKEKAIHYIKVRGKKIQEYVKETYNSENIEEYVSVDFRLLVFGKGERKHLTFEEALDNINTLIDRVYYKDRVYDKVLNLIDYEEQWYDYKGNLISGEMHLKNWSEYVCEYDLDPSKTYKFTEGDLVAYKDYPGAKFIISRAPKNIYTINKGIFKFDNRYVIEGISNKGRYYWDYGILEYYLEKIDEELEEGSFLWYWREIALKRRPFPSNEDIKVLESNKLDILNGEFKTLKSFQ